MTPERCDSARRAATRAGAVVALALCGCSAVVQESHYFATFTNPAPGIREPAQFYRLKVEGSAHFADARYLTGYFDERAVSLFFNELKGPKDGKLFVDGQKPPGSDTKLTPLNSDANEGAFVLIMSTNADSIAGTIGAFAESQVVADSLTRLLNRDRFRAKAQSDALVGVKKAEATALFARVDAQTKSAATAVSGAESAAAYRRALSALAQALGYTGPEFTSVTEAQNWFSLETSRVEPQP